MGKIRIPGGAKGERFIRSLTKPRMDKEMETYLGEPAKRLKALEVKVKKQATALKVVEAQCRDLILWMNTELMKGGDTDG